MIFSFEGECKLSVMSAGGTWQIQENQLKTRFANGFNSGLRDEIFSLFEPSEEVSLCVDDFIVNINQIDLGNKDGKSL